jgi:CDP-diacylglycerol---glycerol-3-phosphate 3-phosphatidyltransferase
VGTLLDRYVVLIPALVPFVYLAVGLAIFSVRVLVGRPPEVRDGKVTQVLGVFWSRYIHWMFRPLERAAINANLHPNTVTITSLLGCAVAGFAVATGHFAIGTWFYVAAGILDMVDGRLARATGKQSEAGAFLDSVLDRWGELFVFAGLAWQLRGSWAIGATLLALGGSLMVSYTRARGESLGVLTNGGAMQRPERVILVSAGCFAAALVDASPWAAENVPQVLGTALAIVGLMSTATAFGRLRAGYRMLLSRAPQPRAVVEARIDPENVPARSRKPVARVLRLGSAFKAGREGHRPGGATTGR